MIKIFTINFLLAVSTGMGMTLLPILATDSLGISLLLLGIIEGTTELVSNILKLVSGNLFDRMKNKRYLFIVPSGISFISKLSIFIFLSKYTILFSKLSERVSNGMFASPRDAYVAKNAINKGLAFSMLSCSKTIGCVIGTLIISMSTLLIGTISENVTNLAMLGAIVTFCALVVSTRIKSDITVKEESFTLQGFGTIFRKLLPVYILAFVFFLARFNDGVLMLFLKSKNMPEWFYLSTISFFNTVMFICSPICGLLLDKKKINYVLFITIGALLLFNVSFCSFDSSPWFFAGCGLVFWGVQRVGAQIIFSFFIAQQTKKKFIGTAIGILALITAVGTLISSTICGYLTRYSFETVFLAAGIISFFTMLLAAYYIVNKRILS